MHFKLLKNKQKTKENTGLKSQKNNKKIQEKSRGRSMVEMLGVLAIIGVLSIGGIQGYTMAMRRYKANEILNVLEKYATIAYTNCLSAQLNGGTETQVNWNNKETLVCPSIQFENAGVGGYPAGVHWITIDDIIRTNSGDMVRLNASFKDQQLCFTIMNVAGIVPVAGTSGTYANVCGLYNDGAGTDGIFSLIVSFIMN